MKEMLSEGDSIKINGFGMFGLKQRKEYLGRNPKTGDTKHVKAKKSFFQNAQRHACPAKQRH